MSVLTVYPSYDGYSYNWTTNPWLTKIAANGSNYVGDSTSLKMQDDSTTTTTDEWQVTLRGFIQFDTSSLGSGASISAAVLSIYRKLLSDTDGMSPTTGWYSATITEAKSDYESVGSTLLSSTLNFDDWGATGYSAFTLNASGRTYINQTGNTDLGSRETVYDAGATKPPWVSDTDVRVIGYGAAETGTTKDPKLIVTYTTSGGAVTITPDVGNLGISGLAPTIITGSSITITPAVGSLEISGLAPTIVTGASTIIYPDVGHLEIGGLAPDVFSGTTALWSATPTSKNLVQFFGVSSGQPIKGFMMLWGQTTDQAKINFLKIRLGSDSSNYALFTFELTDSEDWQYMKSRGVDAILTGTPDWTAVDYCAIEINQSSAGTIKLNGIRINDDSSFTCFNVESTNIFDDYRSPHLSPAKLINQLAKAWEYIWYIDYERDVHFKDKENTVAPYEINDTSDNFTDLKITVDTSSLGNRIKVFGGEKISDSEYTEIKEGDSAKREFNLTSKFSGLEITLDDNSSTDLTEAGTTTTNITATTHGLVTGDYITNRTRANAVRKITYVDDDNFTVEAVTSQTTGDTFSKFATAKTAGIEGLVDETTVDYVYNSNAQSVRATDSEPTYDAGEFLKFTYFERLPINIEYTDSTSANALKALGLGDGIFELDPISDRNIQDDATALSIAQAKVQEFGNPIITGTFRTDQKGLDTGQLLTIVETINRNISADYVIQTIRTKQKEGKFKDYLTFNVQFGTTLFGWIEFMQKLLANGEDVELNTDSVVQTFAVSYEDVECADVNTATLGGILVAEEDEDVECSEVNATYKNANNWKFEPSTGQPVKSRFNLASFG